MKAWDRPARVRLTATDVSMLPRVGVSSSMNDSRPVRIDATVQDGCQVSSAPDDVPRERRVTVRE